MENWTRYKAERNVVPIILHYPQGADLVSLKFLCFINLVSNNHTSLRRELTQKWTPMISENSPAGRSGKQAMVLIGLFPTPTNSGFSSRCIAKDHMPPGVMVTSRVSFVHYNGLSQQCWPDGQISWMVVYLIASQMVCCGWEWGAVAGGVGVRAGRVCPQRGAAR